MPVKIYSTRLATDQSLLVNSGGAFTFSSFATFLTLSATFRAGWHILEAQGAVTFSTNGSSTETTPVCHIAPFVDGVQLADGTELYVTPRATTDPTIFQQQFGLLVPVNMVGGAQVVTLRWRALGSVPSVLLQIRAATFPSECSADLVMVEARV